MTDKEKIIEYIDKLLEKYPKNYFLLMVAEFADSLPEEPVSEDYKKARKEAMFSINEQKGYSFKLQDMFDAGANWKEQQLMKKAIEVTVHIEAGNYPYIPQMELYDYDKDVPLAKEGDKYKVVLIKEE